MPGRALHSRCPHKRLFVVIPALGGVLRNRSRQSQSPTGIYTLAEWSSSRAAAGNNCTRNRAISVTSRPATAKLDQSAATTTCSPNSDRGAPIPHLLTSHPCAKMQGQNSLIVPPIHCTEGKNSLLPWVGNSDQK